MKVAKGGEKLKQPLDHVAGVCSGLACKVKLNPNRTWLYRSCCYPRLTDRENGWYQWLQAWWSLSASLIHIPAPQKTSETVSFWNTQLKS